MKKILSLIAVLTLTACAHFPSHYSGQYETEGARAPAVQTTFNVSKITIASVYGASKSNQYMRRTPDKIAREWLKSRFFAGGFDTNQILEVFIKDASISEKPLIRNGSIDPEYRTYRAQAHIEIKVKRNSQTIGAVFSKAFEERVVENYLSIPEKNKIWEDLIYTALEKADIEMQTGIERYLGDYAR